jgi:transposase
VLELLARAPDPAAVAKLTTAQVSAALKRAHRRHVADKTAVIRAALRASQLTQPARVTAASAAVVRALAAVIVTLNQQIAALERQVEAYFLVHPDTEIVLSSLGWAGSSAPGCSPSPATTRPGTPAPRPARTTPLPARSPASPARGNAA